ncbi:chromosome partitioning protein ParB, partial [Escherichia coli]|nr:chromosome partitioning protein ParB [Escherichia coli]
VQKEVKSGTVSVDVAVDRVKEFGEKAGEVLQKDKASAAAKGKKKVTRSVIAPEITIKKARRLVELISLAGISDTGVIYLEGLVHAEVVEIIDEHKAIAVQRNGAAS